MDLSRFYDSQVGDEKVLYVGALKNGKVFAVLESGTVWENDGKFPLRIAEEHPTIYMEFLNGKPNAWHPDPPQGKDCVVYKAQEQSKPRTLSTVECFAVIRNSKYLAEVFAEKKAAVKYAHATDKVVSCYGVFETDTPLSSEPFTSEIRYKY